MAARVYRSIMLDAGHGGKDPGAVGQGGLKEKDVALAVVKRIGARINDRMAVFYTREDDRFLTLSKRREKTNESGADLLIIASHRPGLQDYFLGSTAAHVVRHAACSVHVIR